MRDILHDEKDELQDIREQWQSDVERVRQDMIRIIREADDPRNIFVEANVLAADALASRTTEAAQLGYKFGERKVKVKNIGIQGKGDENQKG